MVRGDPLAWHPDWIWGQFNHAIGCGRQPGRRNGLEGPARLREMHAIVAGEHPEHQVVALLAALAVDPDARAESTPLNRSQSATLAARSRASLPEQHLGIVVVAVAAGRPTAPGRSR